MRIDRQPLERAGDLVHLYNAGTADVPFCDPVSQETFADTVRWTRLEGSGAMNRQSLLVAMEHGGPAGFAHVAIGSVPHGSLPDAWEADGRDIGAIRFMTYPRGRRGIGQALLDAAQAHLTEQGAQRLIAYPKWGSYPFCRWRFGLLSDRQAHLVGLLGMNGYHILTGETFMTWRNYEVQDPKPPRPSADVVVRRIEDDSDLLVVHVAAKVGHAKIGECALKSAGDYGNSEESRATVFVCWLGVEDAFQGLGWGRFLLHTGLDEARRIGFRHTAISTWWRNHRALLFYANDGYDVVDTAYEFGKDLAAEPV